MTQREISPPYDFNKFEKKDGGKQEKSSTAEYCLIHHQILRTNRISNGRQTMQRIDILILELSTMETLCPRLSQLVRSSEKCTVEDTYNLFVSWQNDFFLPSRRKIGSVAPLFKEVDFGTLK